MVLKMGGLAGVDIRQEKAHGRARRQVNGREG
jgi:hypothetical protein